MQHFFAQSALLIRLHDGSAATDRPAARFAEDLPTANSVSDRFQVSALGKNLSAILLSKSGFGT